MGTKKIFNIFSYFILREKKSSSSWVFYFPPTPSECHLWCVDCGQGCEGDRWSTHCCNRNGGSHLWVCTVALEPFPPSFLLFIAHSLFAIKYLTSSFDLGTWLTGSDPFHYEARLDIASPWLHTSLFYYPNLHSSHLFPSL